MAITAAFRQQVGTPKTVKSSGGTVTWTPTSLANGSYWQTPKMDLGATFAQAWAVYADLEFAATPVAGNTVSLWANPSSSGTAGTDNRGGTVGTDAAFTGYSSNAAASVIQLQFIGSGTVTAQATTTVQKIFIGVWYPVREFNSFVFLNASGAALHSTITNCVLTFEPLEGTSEAS